MYPTSGRGSFVESHSKKFERSVVDCERSCLWTIFTIIMEPCDIKAYSIRLSNFAVHCGHLAILLALHRYVAVPFIDLHRDAFLSSCGPETTGRSSVLTLFGMSYPTVGIEYSFIGADRVY